MITLVHLKNGQKKFKKSKDFVNFVKSIRDENEDRFTINNLEDAKYYVNNFCSNFELL